ncbi:unnamed protein product, partial [Scytosiphon promiscuus]
MERKRPEDRWIASLEAIAQNPRSQVDQARLTATYTGEIFAERRRKEQGASGGSSSGSGGGSGRRRELPRFFVRPPSSNGGGSGPGRPPPDSNSSGSGRRDGEPTAEESRVAEARSKLRAKARSRFLQRREEALMGFEDLSEVERALATCVPPPPPSPPVTPVPEGQIGSGGDGGSSGGTAAGSATGTGAVASLSSREVTQDRPNGERGGATAAVTSGEEPLSSLERSGVEVSGGGGDAVDGGGVAAVDPHPPQPPPNPYVGAEAQGGSADYMDFVRVRGLVSRKAAACFKPRTFLRFPRDIRGRIPSRTFFKRVYESVTLQKTRLTLHFYDSEGLGFLREQDLENYVYDHIPTMPALRAIHDSFYPFYVFTAVRRFMFFLDPKRSGKILIDTLVRSSIMEEFLQVRMAAGSAPGTDPSNDSLGAKGAGSGRKAGGGGDSPAVGDAAGEGGQGEAAPGETLPQDLSKNWFSAENTLRVYGEYLELDEDQNGMLSKQELMNFGARQRTRLTPVFVQRLFEEVVTYRVQAPPSSSTPPPHPPTVGERASDQDHPPDSNGGIDGGSSSGTPLSLPSTGDAGGAHPAAGADSAAPPPADAPPSRQSSTASPPPMKNVPLTSPPSGGTAASSPTPTPAALPSPTSPSGSPSSPAAATVSVASSPLACPVPRASAVSRSSLLALSPTASGGARTPSPTRSHSSSPGGAAAAATSPTTAAVESPTRSPGRNGANGGSASPLGSQGVATAGGNAA